MKQSVKNWLITIIALIVLGTIFMHVVSVKETKDISTSKTGDWLNQSK